MICLMNKNKNPIHFNLILYQLYNQPLMLKIKLEKLFQMSVINKNNHQRNRNKNNNYNSKK